MIPLILGSLWGCQESTHQQRAQLVNDSLVEEKKTIPSPKVVKKPEKVSASPPKVLEIPYDASAGQKRALLAEEAYENPRDYRTYGADPKAKAKGQKLDCSYFVREVEATFRSDEARKTKQQKGYLTPPELVKYNSFFTNKRLYATKITSMSGKMAYVLQKHGFYSTRVADVRLGDYVFIGKGKTRNLKSIGHVMVIHKIDTVAGQKRYYFIDAGYRGIKKINGVMKRVKRSVRKGYHMTAKGTVWSGKYIRYFKGTGRTQESTSFR